MPSRWNILNPYIIYEAQITLNQPNYKGNICLGIFVNNIGQLESNKEIRTFEENQKEMLCVSLKS